jgi:hypothetical protein
MEGLEQGLSSTASFLPAGNKAREMAQNMSRLSTIMSRVLRSGVSITEAPGSLAD